MDRSNETLDRHRGKGRMQKLNAEEFTELDNLVGFWHFLRDCESRVPAYLYKEMQSRCYGYAPGTT